MPINYQEDLQRDADMTADNAADVSMIPIIGAGMSAGKTAKARQLLGKRAEDIINDVELPTFSNEDYGLYSLAGEFSPEAAQYQTISEDPRIRQVQEDALQSLIDRGNGAADAKMQAAQFGAMDEAGQLARAREDAIRMDAARKGQSGSGMDAVMRAQASQAAANRARAGSQQAVIDAALEKLAATQGAMAGADQMRGRDFQRNSANAGILNEMNKFNTQARNQAAQMNLQARQGIMNANVDQRNRGIDRRDRNTQQGFGNTMTKATSRGNALQGMSNAAGQGQTQQQAANAAGYGQAKDIISGIAGLFSKKPKDDEE